jgi:hypothetical protein
MKWTIHAVGSRLWEACENLSWAQLCPIIGRLILAWPQPQKSAGCSTAAFPKLFMFREVKSRFLLLQCHTPPWELLLHLLFFIGYKRLTEGGCEGFLMWNGLIGWWLARGLPQNAAAAYWVMLEIRVNMGHCKSEYQDFKKAKENMGQSESKERDFKE